MSGTSTVENPAYNFRRCQYQYLLHTIVDVCGCFPVYMRDGIDLVEGEWPSCSFYMHATCVSMTKHNVESSQTLCQPACNEYSIFQESIYVRQQSYKYFVLKYDFLSTQN